MDYTSKWILDNLSNGTLDIELERGDRAWDPSSTKRKIRGPRAVKYLRHEDGGVDARIGR